MIETEKKLLDEYCDANFNYELWKYPEKADELKEYIYNSFSFRCYLFKHYRNKLFIEIFNYFSFNLIKKYL